MNKFLINFSTSILCLSTCQLTQASPTEAMTAFANGVGAAFNFKNDRIIEELSASLSSFTSAGRMELLREYERTQIIHEATKNNGSLQTTLSSSTLTSNKSIGRDGLDEYRINGTLQMLWQRCIQRTCVPVGESRSLTVSGTVGSEVINNRPSYRIKSIIIDGIKDARK